MIGLSLACRVRFQARCLTIGNTDIRSSADPGVVAARSQCQLAGLIVAGRRLTSLHACLRWFPVWLPENLLALLIKFISWTADRNGPRWHRQS
jgi:hypothetical protein